MSDKLGELDSEWERVNVYTGALDWGVVKVRDVIYSDRAEQAKRRRVSLVTDSWHSIFSFCCSLAVNKVSSKHFILVSPLPQGKSYYLLILTPVLK